MKPTVHILATCRSPELARMTELVFDTLRVGFPTADVCVWVNRDAAENCYKLISLCNQVGARTMAEDTIHHDWIAKLIETSPTPFFTLDTDVIFYDSMERFAYTDALHGFKVPEWQDEFSGALTRSRLHPSLLYINPELVKRKVAKSRSGCPVTPFTPFADLINPLMLPLNGNMCFHDTTGLLYHAIGGTEFTLDQKNSYFHFNFGTIPDVVLPRLSNREPMITARQLVLDDPSIGRGLWAAQEEYYANHQPKSKPIVITELSSGEIEKAMEWNRRVCLDDPDAMRFNDLWYQYCHGIDDLVDTMDDGRPKMDKEQILGLFIAALQLYNCDFFVRYRQMLFPTVLTVTNSFADSVAWEKSPLAHRRTMADCLRTCGNEMYYIVAMIKGGWNHARGISQAIRERDYLMQHDKDGNPT